MGRAVEGMDVTTTDDRGAARTQFLASTPWAAANPVLLTADASTRRYYRLEGGAHQALLMDAPPKDEAPSCPVDADEGARRALGYNAMARLAGPRLEAFTSLSALLVSGGVRAPKIYHDDPQAGFAVIEDFGDQLLTHAIAAGKSEAELYRQALAVLKHVRQLPIGPGRVVAWDLQTYDRLVLQCEADLLTEWYAPFSGASLGGEAQEAWVAAWAEVFDRLSPPHSFVLRDFHAENILVNADGGIAVIDFQDGLFGHAAYDVASLLEDARRDVDLGLAKELFTEEAQAAADPDGFAQDYAILAAQRNAKILGIFARLIRRDEKEKYRAFIPRVQAHFRRDMDRPAVAPIRAWAERYFPALLADGDAP